MIRGANINGGEREGGLAHVCKAGRQGRAAKRHGGAYPRRPNWSYPLLTHPAPRGRGLT
jgi:hypothetical protein